MDDSGSQIAVDAGRESNVTVHMVFGIVLLAILALKYFLYFQSEVSGTGLTAGRIGATLSHLLIWTFAYRFCLQSTRRLLMGIVAAITLFFGVITVPLLGWLGILVMFILLRIEQNRHDQGMASG